MESGVWMARVDGESFIIALVVAICQTVPFELLARAASSEEQFAPHESFDHPRKGVLEEPSW